MLCAHFMSIEIIVFNPRGILPGSARVDPAWTPGGLKTGSVKELLPALYVIDCLSAKLE